jgi:predicted dehydrogenase
VDVIYIGTPPTFHHQNAKEALLAGKHVLCEKPFTFDLEELDELIALAKSKNLFLMESVLVFYTSLRLAACADPS